MKKIIVSVFVLFMLNISAGFCFSSAGIGDAVKNMPESTDFIIKFSSIKDIYTYLSIDGKSILGEQIESINEIKEGFGVNPFDLKELEAYGFDVTKEFGVAVTDIKVVNGEETPQMNLLIFIPVKDSDKAAAKIKELIEDDNPDAKFTKKGDIWSWYIDVDYSEPEDLEEDDSSQNEDDAQQSAVQEEPEAENAADTSEENEESASPPIACYMISKNGYLFICTNPSVDAEQFLVNFGKDEKKLIDQPVFTSVINKIDPSSEIFLYSNLGRIFNSNPQIMNYFIPDVPKTAENGTADSSKNGAVDSKNNSSKAAQEKNKSGLASWSYLKDYQGAGFAVDLKSSDLKAEFALNILEKSLIFNLFKDAAAKRDLILGFKENPLLLIGAVENLQVYWQMLQETIDKESLSEIKKQFATIKKDYNIDIEKELIDNLGTNISLGVYDAVSINMANINTLAAVEFKEPAKINSAIEKLTAKLKPEQQSMINKLDINGNQVYMLPAGPFQLYAGFIGNNLVFTLGKPMFEKALAAGINNSFMNQIKDESLKKSLKEDISILFFDINEAMKAAKNFLPMLGNNPDLQIVMMPEFQKIISNLNYVSAFSRIEKNAVVGDFLFKTNFNKPFFQGVKDTLEQINALKKDKKL